MSVDKLAECLIMHLNTFSGVSMPKDDSARASNRRRMGVLGCQASKEAEFSPCTTLVLDLFLDFLAYLTILFCLFV